ncbi:hypothetical protein [Arcticibacter sp.]|uniref:hypothetical protein n=1 Tax=Arcticibacter sp. TaxID=1872630 RepID=UPI00388ED39F
MAILDKDGFLRGKKGDSIFRRVNDKPVVSQAPSARKQTDESKSTAFEFGLASNTARAIRFPLGMYYLGLDGGLVNRLNTAVRFALLFSPFAEAGRRDLHDAELAPLAGLQFNAHAPLNRLLKPRPQVTLRHNFTLNITLPGFSPKKDLLYPKTGFYVGCTLTIAPYAFDFRREFYIQLASRETAITQPYFEGFDWDFDEYLPAGAVVLVCMSLQYHIQSTATERKILNIRQFSPTELVAAYHIPPDPGQAATGWQDNYLPSEGYRGNEMLRNMDPRWTW